MSHAVFIDWLTASQYHPNGGLPVLVGGLNVFYDSRGIPRTERSCSAPVLGSFDTTVRIKCDGFRVCLSGNVGRFGRQDNLFNLDWEGTQRAANRILAANGLPAFTGPGLLFDGTGVAETARQDEICSGAKVSRLDVTANFAAGSDAQARAVIRWIGSQAVSRCKRGQVGDESVWWANTRYMFKAYRKLAEMLAHGANSDEAVAAYCLRNGLVRVEIELKRRLLAELKMNDWDDITQEKLEAAYCDQTEILRRVDRSEEPDLLASIPSRSRAYAAAWLRGEDLSCLVSQATLYRHAKILKDYGLDVFQPRNVVSFPSRVTVIEMQPLEVPDWYELQSRLRAV
ncbi:hypothetical protein GCM10027046_04240 [Uliginosibacterium flavum]|uniref:Phage/plasmid replication protein n=1 Tax=Uliginosibacterium flavum TaxID=1396831 RepID=A0ABV2TJA9_9RHOO